MKAADAPPGVKVTSRDLKSGRADIQDKVRKAQGSSSMIGDAGSTIVTKEGVANGVE